MTDTATIILTECYDSSEGVIHIHAPGCRDIARWKAKTFGGSVYPAHVEAGSTVAQAGRSLAEDFNSDFASDYSMTPGAYLDSGQGYPVHMLPCAEALVAASSHAVVVDEVVVATVSHEDISEAADGSAEAAAFELARRKANRLAKKSGGARIEPVSDWAFAATSKELKALLG